ncbi:MAG: RidA family protein [Promethearchaeota archaeon]|jgi:2-iminobutanoate/2-iminopropanoate deaminase
MVEKEVIDIGTPKAGPYSLGLKAGNLVFISGQVMDPGANGIKEQTFTALEKIKKILEAAGATVSDIVKITVYLKSMLDFKEMNSAYRDFLEKNGVDEKFPTRTTIEAVCPLPNGLVEIDAIAVI